MALVKSRPKYRCGGDFSVRDRNGQECHFSAGDILPDDIEIPQREIDILLGRNTLQELGARPAPRPREAPPRTPTVAEIFQQRNLDYEHVPGYDVHVFEQASDGAIKKVIDLDRRAIVAHQAGGVWVGTLDLGQLARLLAIAGFGVR